MKKTDKALGMHRKISRRDFIHDLSLASIGMSLPGMTFADEIAAIDTPITPMHDNYPPSRTGLRGSHPGAFENAHKLAREGKNWQSAKDSGESYDLVIVGGGISGLASAYYYRKQHPSARILILENHDDFGGHAKRNEFHQGGQMRLSWGGTMNLEHQEFSDTVNEFLIEIGVDVQGLLKQTDFSYGYDGKKGPAIYFDKQTYGKDVLAVPCNFRDFSLTLLADKIDEFPLSDVSKTSLKNFVTQRTDITKSMSETEIHQMMHKTSYIDFLLKFGKLTAEAATLFIKTTDGYWGVSAHSLSVAECIGAGLPIKHILGGGDVVSDNPVGGSVAMFPDGNASIARLLVRKLIPAVAPGKDMDDIVTAKFDYSMLDKVDSAIKLRLNSTVINVQHEKGREAVSVSYIKDDAVLKVKAKHCILACYHSIIPHLCPELPKAQKQAASYQVKRPLIVTNVLLKSSKAADKLGISGAYCPGRMHGATWLVKGVNTADYKHDWNDDGPVAMMFWGAIAANQQGLTIKEQHRNSRMQMLSLKFEDYEREVRTVLDGMLGPAGFDVETDILAITVNRWPHGYSYDYLDLWDPDWPEGSAPHEIARKAFGNIAIANADAGANALTNVAIDEAFRAVNDLS
ncbi:MAG: spermidine dehydrogenase [Enterobacterales bacterium]|jgi:spermidine dehydrogenase